MQIMSTDQPPRVPLVVSLAPTSTDQPPHPQSQQQLQALSTGDALGTMDFWRIRLLMDQGAIPPVRVGARTPVVLTTEQEQQYALLSKKSPAVMLMLATADFWAATQVSGSAWSDIDGIATSSVSLVPRSGPPTHWVHTLPAVSKAAYLGSVTAVAATMGGAPGDILQQVKAQAGLPHLFLPIALGMADEGATEPGLARPLTCAVVDLVHAVVSVAVHRLKHLLLVPRPDDNVAFPGNGVTPLIPVPGYTAYPSGHSALMSAMATVLSSVVGANSAQAAELQALASTIAKNRERAGLHTALDTEAGDQLGRALGGWMIDAVQHPAFGPWSALYAMASHEWS